MMQAHTVAKQRYYEGLDGYAFELVRFMQGANHYGEREYYKFFSNGTGFHLFEAWHDKSDCNDLDCTLESRSDTITFNYSVKGHRIIVFDQGLLSDMKEQATVVLDVDNREIVVGEQYYPLQLSTAPVNWDEVKKITER